MFKSLFRGIAFCLLPAMSVPDAFAFNAAEAVPYLVPGLYTVRNYKDQSVFARSGLVDFVIEYDSLFGEYSVGGFRRTGLSTMGPQKLSLSNETLPNGNSKFVSPVVKYSFLNGCVFDYQMEIVPLRDRIHIREYYPLFARRWPNGQCEFTEYGWHTYPIDPLNGNHIEAYRYAAHNAADAKERTKYELFEAFSGLSLSEEEALAKLSAALEAGFDVNAKDWRGRTLLSWVAWRQWPKAFSQVLQLSTLSEEPQDSLYNDFPSFLRCWSDLRAAVDCQLLPWDQRQVFMTMLLDKALSDGRSNILHNLRYRYIPTAMPDSDWLDRYAAQHPLTPEHLTDLITANAPFFFRISGGLEGKNLKETTAFVVDLTKRGAPRRGIVDWFNFVGQTANAADGLTKDNAWHFDVLFQLIDAGFDPEADADGQSILEAIVQLKFAAPHLQRLVKTYPHLNFDARNIFGYSPLGTIINLSRPRALFDLVIKRTDINVPQGTNGDTYLHLAASQLSGSNDSPYLASILAEKPKMNILNKSGETALDVLTQIIDQKSGSDYHRYCTDDVKLRVRYYHQMARLGARHVKTKPPGAFILNCY